ncbi:hypothetical protein FAF44_46605 [Nonomuraea sp. MG754425]|uniref:hypothetical protein n=1 Tax=Nonomuraea sp. MG754425 TaxID=2570319 RepID=UPI001F2AB8B9|nr:hypothetical protein [Nonomuraea sp. MG754425]MCF6475765.1 hypothetical protein [Nonomuraea sp. MG754425]
MLAAHLDFFRAGGHKGGMELLWPFLSAFPLSLGTEWAWDAGLSSLMPADPVDPARLTAHLWALTTTGLVQTVILWLAVRGIRARSAERVGGAANGTDSSPDDDTANVRLTKVTLIYLSVVTLLCLLGLFTMRAGLTEPWIGGDHNDLWPLAFYATFPMSLLASACTGLFMTAVNHGLLVLETFAAGMVQAFIVWAVLRRPATQSRGRSDR